MGAKDDRLYLNGYYPLSLKPGPACLLRPLALMDSRLSLHACHPVDGGAHRLVSELSTSEKAPSESTMVMGERETPPS